MNFPVAVATQGDQIGFAVRAQTAPELEVVYLEARSATTALTSPPVAL
jgi:hypothetical protein